MALRVECAAYGKPSTVAALAWAGAPVYRHQWRRYADTPMDFADATLVLLAERLAVHEILTLDRRGFNTYRLSNGAAFELVLDSA